MAPEAEVYEVHEELEIIEPSGGDVMFPEKNYCIGIINISKLESIQYHKEVVGSGIEESVQYHITISYIGSSMDSDGTLTISGNVGSGLRSHFQTEAAMERAIQKLINGISMAMQKSQTSTSPFVVEYYPMFDLGNTTLRSNFSPYDRDNAVDPNEELMKQVIAMMAGAHLG